MRVDAAICGTLHKWRNSNRIASVSLQAGKDGEIQALGCLAMSLGIFLGTSMGNEVNGIQVLEGIFKF